MDLRLPFAPQDSSSYMGSVGRMLLRPLLARFRNGEGVLLAINVSLIAARRDLSARAIGLALLSIFTLALMYAVNDWWDAPRDRKNPRKDHAHASMLAAHRKQLGTVLLVLHVIAIAAAAWLAGVTTVAAVVATLSINALYSFFLKGFPVLDVVAVGLWGGTYAAMVGPAAVVAVVSAMTAASHVFQAAGDRDADLSAGITTSAANRTLALAMLTACSAVLIVSAWTIVGLPFALTGFAPIVAALVMRRPLVAWLSSKLVFTLLWLDILRVLHGLHS